MGLLQKKLTSTKVLFSFFLIKNANIFRILKSINNLFFRAKFFREYTNIWREKLSLSIKLKSNQKHNKMATEEDQRLREIQREYLDFLDDEVCMAYIFKIADEVVFVNF